MVKNLPAKQGDTGLIPGGEDLLEKEMAIHSCILAWKYAMDRGVWLATVYGVAKSWTRLTTEHACTLHGGHV